MYSIGIRNLSVSRGEKYKLGVYYRFKLIEELGTFSVDTYGNRYLRVDFDRLDYYLSGGAKFGGSLKLESINFVLKQLISLRLANNNNLV